jgi:Putative zinc-finger
LPEALSGRLEPAEERRVMAHLENCPACQDAAADIEIALVSLATLRVARDEATHGIATPLHVPHSDLTHSDITLADPIRVVDVRDAKPATDLTASAPSQAGRAPVSDVPVLAEHAERRGRRRRTQLLAAAAAVVLLAGGAFIGRQLLPPRDTHSYGPPVALAPPAAATPDARAARGSVAVAKQGDALAVKLKATALPAAGWYECVWISAGQTRSAGSFRATKGAVDVDLLVASPVGGTEWDLQVIEHQGTTSRVVLEGRAAAQT